MTIIRLSARRLSAGRLSVGLLALATVVILAGCSTTRQSPDVVGPIRTALNQPEFKDVSVSQDRDKGVVTLNGHVDSDADKTQAESIARGLAEGQVVADQVAVASPGEEKATKAISSDLDAGIEKNLDAALIENRMHDNVKYSVKNGVATLTGQVGSQSKRAAAEKVASGIPNVVQVVNELQVKDQKASSSY